MNFPSKYKRQIFTALHFSIFILFLYSAISKVITFELFVNTLDKSPFFINIKTTWIAVLVIMIEILIPATLFFELTSRIGYLFSFFLLFVFTGYILLMMRFSPYMPCSCGGLIETLSWNQHLYFNVVYMAISALLYFRFTETKSEN